MIEGRGMHIDGFPGLFIVASPGIYNKEKQDARILNWNFEIVSNDIGDGKYTAPTSWYNSSFVLSGMEPVRGMASSGNRLIVGVNSTAFVFEVDEHVRQPNNAYHFYNYVQRGKFFCRTLKNEYLLMWLCFSELHDVRTLIMKNLMT
jgi:hypothetical protein